MARARLRYRRRAANTSEALVPVHGDVYDHLARVPDFIAGKSSAGQASDPMIAL
jgi:hypothetical protein